MVKEFSAFLTETHLNLFGDRHKDEMHAHKHELFGMLKKSYESIGGIHGNGFNSPDDMVNKIHMWKLHKKNGKITAATLYKNKNGRKGVAVATDGTEEGKTHLSNMMHQEAHRAWGEKSGRSLSFFKRTSPSHSIIHHAIPYDTAKTLHDDEIRRPPHDDPEIIRHPELKHHFYQRRIGDGPNAEWHTKIAVGTPHHHIT